MMFDDPDIPIDRRTMIKGAAALTVAGVVAGCGDEEVEPEPDPQEADPFGAPE